MPQNNYDPAPHPADAAPEEAQRCPKCRAEMEPIESGVDGPPFQELQLCPGCYVVTWRDQDGPHIRQGVPVKPGVNPMAGGAWAAGEPEEC